MLSAWLGGACIAAGFALALAQTGCEGSNSDKAGGGEDRLVILTIATREENDAWVNFAAAVEAESQGTVRLAARTRWRAGEADFERATIADVRSGAVDLAEVGAGVWDTVGVTSFRAVVAPFLIQDLALESRVLESPLVQTMLEGVQAVGLVGLAVLPGELRRPFGISRHLLGPEDYSGASVASRVGRVGRATWAALGARPVVGAAGETADVAENDLATIDSNRLDASARSLTANVVLWPRVRTIVASRRAFEKLTVGQRQALRRAGRRAVEPALRRVEADEVRALARICRRGTLRFRSASASELSALTASVQPVYALLERDPRTREQVEAIRRLRARGSLSPTTVNCSGSGVRQAPTAGSPLDGKWEMTVTREELIRLGTPPIEADGVRGRWTYTIGNGRFEIRNHDLGHVWSGSAAVDGRGVTIVIERCPAAFRPGCSPGETYEHRWSRYRDRVTFARVAGRTYAPIFLVKPWIRRA